MMKFLYCKLALLLLTFTTVVNGSVLEREDVRLFVQDMVARHGFNEADLNSVFEHVEIIDSIIEAISRPAEKKPWYQYRPIFLKPDRIKQGVEFWEANAEPLARAEAVYGVPAEIIVAIIGVETRYGRDSGRYKVINSLATLAFDYPKRAAFFTGELEHFLLMSREQAMDPLSITGSYAGAMGIPQFIASSYRNYAVDFDRDGVVDIINNKVDAIGSVGNYFKIHGWVAGEPITRPAEISGDGFRQYLTDGLELDTTTGELTSHGLAIPDLQGNTEVKLLEFENQDQNEYWLGFRNFYVITRYNNSMLYAMVVFQLAREIRSRYTAP